MSSEFITSGNSHWYKSPTKDIYYPSATTILSAFPKGEGFSKYLAAQASWESSQEALQAAGKRGTNVHKGSEMLESGVTLNRALYTLQEWQMLIGFVNWHQKHKPKMLQMEYGMVSDKLKTGGTIDRVYMIDSELVIWDLKSSGAIYDNYWAQVAIYAEMYEEKHKVKVAHTAILRVSDKKKGGFEYLTRSRIEWKKDLKIFKATRQLWDYINPDAQPKIVEVPDTLSLV